jgi:hypothetical protein
MSLMILLPWDRGYPHILWCDGKSAVISGHVATVLRTYGLGFSSEYRLVEGKPVDPKVTYPSRKELNLEGARLAADDISLRLSKKARSILRGATL